MDRDPRVAEIIDEAESRIAALATEATSQRNYVRASALLALAQRVMEAARSLGFASSPQFETSPDFGAAAHEEDLSSHTQPTTISPEIAPNYANRVITLNRTSPGSSYPRFKREGDILVKIGWSKSDRATYEHRSPRDVLNRLVAAVKAVQTPGERFTTEDLMPLRDDQGNELPSYQAYLCLAWIVSAGILEKHGRQGYTLNSADRLDQAVEEAWTSLPKR